MSDTLTVLTFCGSLRSGSYNASALRAAQALAPSELRFDAAVFDDLPHYDADLQAAGFPAAVERLGTQLRAADARPARSSGGRAVPAITPWASRPHRSVASATSRPPPNGRRPANPATAGRGNTGASSANGSSLCMPPKVRSFEQWRSTRKRSCG